MFIIIPYRVFFRIAVQNAVDIKAWFAGRKLNG